MFRNKKNDENQIRPFKRKIFKKLTTAVMAIGMLAISIAPSTAFASDSYFLTFTYDADSKLVVPGVTLSKVANGVNNHAEIDNNGADFLHTKDDDLLFKLNGGSDVSFTLPVKNPDKRKEITEYMYTIPFSFPGRHVGTGVANKLNDADTARNGTSSDQAQAQWVGQQLTSGFNRVFSSAHLASGGSKNSDKLIDTAQKLANAALSGGETSFENGDNEKLTVKFSEVNAEDISNRNPDIPASYYRRVKMTSDVSSRKDTEFIVPVKVPKGYKEGQRMYDRIDGTPYHKAEHHIDDAEYISWQHMIMQATHNAKQSIMATDVSELNPPGRVEREVINMLSGLTGTIRGFLGLEPITDLVFNKGVSGDSTIYGTMPIAMGSVANFVHFLVLILSGFILLGSFVSLLIKSNLSVINPQMRVDMKDGLMTIFGAFFILLIFQPIWASLMRINASLVEYFYNFSNTTDAIGTSLVGGSGSLAAIILSIAFLIVEIWFNFYYIVRALTIMALYMFAPLMIISIAYGGKYKQIFSNWSKELLGALFIQGIHAAILGAISAGLSQGLAQSLMWQYVILVSIIPLSNMFRKNILTLGGDSIGQTANKAEKASFMGAAIGGGLALKAAGTIGSQGISAIAGSAGGAGGGSGGMSGASSGGGGGGGTGKTKLGDQPQDLSGTGMSTAQDGATKGKVAQFMDNQKSAISSDLKQLSDKHPKISQGMKATGKVAGTGIKNAAQWADSGGMLGGRTLGSGVKNVTGGMLAAGAVAGDMATDADSHSALIAGASRFQSKGGNRGGGKSFGGRNSSSESDILALKPPESQLDKLSNSGALGDQGALTLQKTPDNQQMVTYDKEEMTKQTGISNVESIAPDGNFRNGRTRVEISDTSGFTPENKAALEYASNLHEKVQNGTATGKDREIYDAMPDSGTFANVAKNGDGGFVVDIDNQSRGWDGVASDKNHVMVKGDATANKRLPNFNKDEGDTSDLRMWHKESGRYEEFLKTQNNA